MRVAPDIFQTQEELQKEASKILEDLGLLALFGKYGEVAIVGSMRLGLMTRKDIDIEIVVPHFDKTTLKEILTSLCDKQFLRLDLTMIDNTTKQSQNLPVGFYIGIQYAGPNILIEKMRDNPLVWHIDAWFVTMEHARSTNMTNSIQEKLTPETKKIILEIKSELTKNPEYKNKFSGLDIYNAVLEKEITTVQDFLSASSK